MLVYGTLCSSLTFCWNLQVFENGALYSPKVLDIKDEELLTTVSTALTRIAAASLELDYPTAVSVPHSIIKGFKNVLAVSVATDYDFPLAEKVRHQPESDNNPRVLL